MQARQVINLGQNVYNRVGDAAAMNVFQYKNIQCKLNRPS